MRHVTGKLSEKRLRRIGGSSRRGVALIVVLAILAVCMGVAYASMRGQFTMVQVQRNSVTQGSARQAALTGLSIAIQKMHDADWTGVDTTIGGDLGENTSYSATFSVGDPAIEDPANDGQPNSAHADYSDWPFRVTVLSTGTAVTHTGGTTTHHARAVLKLIPRALATEPTGWDDVQNYVAYQTKNDSFFLHPPVRIDGRVRIRGQLEFGKYFAWDQGARDQFLGDLRAMELAGYSEQKILTGPIDMPYDLQGVSYYSLEHEDLESLLGVSTSDASTTEHTSVQYPGDMSTYRLYPGGKLYSVPVCIGTLQNMTSGPNPHTNPAGICATSGQVTLHNNVDLTGTMIATSTISLRGSNLSIRPVSLPALHGTSAPVQLVTLASEGDIRVYEHCSGDIAGMLTAERDFEVYPFWSGIDLSIKGRVLFTEMKYYGRISWPTMDWQWDGLHDGFLAGQNSGHTSMVEGLLAGDVEGDPDNLPENPQALFFPSYVENAGHPLTPRIVIKGPASEVRYHWPTDGAAIYAAHPDDSGLMWDLIDWDDGV